MDGSAVIIETAVCISAGLSRMFILLYVTAGIALHS